MNKTTKHLPWIEDFISAVAPYEARVVNSPLFAELAAGTLSMPKFRAGLLYFYPLIEAFPQYMALTLAKVPLGITRRNDMAREWLIQNMNVERKHVRWYRRWAIDFGVSEQKLKALLAPPPEIDAVNNYLWRVVYGGSLAESLAAVNYGIEGPSGIWTKLVKNRLKDYGREKGVNISRPTLLWINAHADYDDTHPEEALQLITSFARTRQDRASVTAAAQRAMEYYAMAADACYHMPD